MEDYLETHFEVVQAILSQTDLNGDYVGRVKDIVDTQGTGGLYLFAKDLTDQFETMYAERVWDGDWLSTLEDFLTEQFTNY